MTAVHVVVPDGIADPGRPSGGNTYDRRLGGGLRALHWDVHEIVAPGPWPRPDAASLAGLAQALGAVPDDALVVVDGLIASAADSVLVPESERLRLVVLVHMPLGDVAVDPDGESRVLEHARAVVTTSAWTRGLLVDRYPLRPDHVHVARPGVDPADEAPGTPDGSRLLCVGAVVPHKGQDVLLDALFGIVPSRWTCTIVGPLDRNPAFVGRLLRRTADFGMADRIRFIGPRRDEDLGAQYRGADLLVLPSRLEAYGMVVTEALAVGLPVVASAVGGVPEALGRTDDGPPGLLVRPDDPDALGEAIDAWLRDGDLRARLRRAARERRRTLTGWEATAERVSSVLHAVGSSSGADAGRPSMAAERTRRA
jgi:glycosyltransferase involved in cell wall biosynthesis